MNGCEAEACFVRKVKSQLCAWTTSAVVCAEGFGAKKDLQLCAQRPVAMYAALRT